MHNDPRLSSRTLQQKPLCTRTPGRSYSAAALAGGRRVLRGVLVYRDASHITDGDTRRGEVSPVGDMQVCQPQLRLVFSLIAASPVRMGTSEFHGEKSGRNLISAAGCVHMFMLGQPFRWSFAAAQALVDTHPSFIFHSFPKLFIS